MKNNKKISWVWFALVFVFTALIATVDETAFTFVTAVFPLAAGIKNYSDFVNKIGAGKKGGEMIDLAGGYDFLKETPGAFFLQNFARTKAGEVRNSTEARVVKFSRELLPYLHPDNSFTKRSVNDSDFAASGYEKRIANQAAGPVGVKGRIYGTGLAHGAAAPVQTVKIRKNDFLSWLIEYFSTPPDAITRELTSEVSYDARQDLLQSHAAVLNDMTANYTAVEWAQGTVGTPVNVETDGTETLWAFTSSATARANTIPGTSNTVKKITKADFMNVKSLFYKQNIINGNTDNIYFLPTVEMYNDLLEIDEFTSYEQLGHESKLIRGEVGMIMGITVLAPRHREDWGGNSVLYTYAAGVGTTVDLTLLDDTGSAAINMVGAGLFWIDKQVKRAEGQVIVFPWQNSPLHMGDVYATESRYAAQRKRKDNKGVIMLVETPV